MNITTANKPKRKYTINPNRAKATRSDKGKPRPAYRKRSDLNKDALFSSHYTSMRVSPETQLKGWAYLQQPAIYEIVCKSSGNRYIGCSTRPDLRRAVHLYWLKNYWKWGNSNVFFGNVKIARDVEQYGVDDFEMNIIQTFDKDISIEALKEAEQRFLQEHKIKKLYNRNDFTREEQSIKGYTVISDLEPAVKKAYQKFKSASDERYAFIEWYSNEFMPYKSERRNAIFDARKQKAISSREAMKMHRALSDEAQVHRNKFKKLESDVKRLKLELRNLIQKSYKKYKDAKKCLY